MLRRVIIIVLMFASLSAHYRSYDSESTDTLLDGHQMNDGSITPNSASMGSDSYYLPTTQTTTAKADEQSLTVAATASEKKTPRERKKHDKFEGLSEEEVCKLTLPDYLEENLDIVIVSEMVVGSFFINFIQWHKQEPFREKTA